MISLEKSWISAFFKSSIAFGCIFTLNAMITPYSSSSSLAMDASITSLLLTSPIPAILIGISISLRRWTTASREPNVSALTRIPSSSVLTVISFNSSSNSDFASSLSVTTLRGEPETTSSRLGADILIPAAATTSSTFSNLFLDSRISSRGRGFKIERILVVMTSLDVIKASSSPLRNTPS